MPSRKPGTRGLNFMPALFALLAATEVVAQEACPEVAIDVSGATTRERLLVCTAAADAIRRLGLCEIAVRRRIRVEIADSVRHPSGRPVFGYFDPKREIVMLTRYENAATLAIDTPYGRLSHRDFYMSMVVHEITHAVMHQNERRKGTSHSALEYPAYALQLASLSPKARDSLLSAIPGAENIDSFLFNDIVLSFDPFLFAARAYAHFAARGNGCSRLTSLLDGDVDFIATLP